MRKLLATVVGLSSALAASVASAAVMQLNPVYLGSTYANVTAPPTVTGDPNTGLKKYQVFSGNGTPGSNNDPLLRHWFRVELTFNGAAGEDFKSVVFDVNNTPLVTKVNRAGSPTSSIPGKWIGNNPTDSDLSAPVFSSNADGGVANDLNAVNVAIVTDPAVAQFYQIGEAGAKGQTDVGFPANLGYFQVTLNDPAPTAVVPDQVSLSMTGAATGANNVSYFTGNGGGAGTVFTTGVAGFQGGTFTFTVPEPSLMGLAAGGLVMLGRRRRMA